MLTYVVGDLFQSPAHVLVNTVNTVGVMGKGIAKTFKTVYPEMFARYRELCETKKLTVGKVWLFKTSNKWVLNFPTKTTWRQPSKVEYIEAGLKAFVNGYAERGITSIAFPLLGCGNGELDWNTQVRPMMEKYLRPLPIDIFVYVYDKAKHTPEHRDVKTVAQWLRAEPETLGFPEVWLDLKRLIASGIALSTFNTGQEFRIECMEADEGILIHSGNKTETIYYEDLLGFWDFIRSYGFGYPPVVPPAVAPYRDYLLPLYGALPYFREISAGRDYRSLDTETAKGIQFVPRPATALPLYNRSPEHLVAV